MMIICRVIDDFYAAEGLEVYQTDFKFEKVQNLCQYASANSEEILAEQQATTI